MSERRFNLRTGDVFRLASWLSSTHPEIFKEFIAVNDVINKANEPTEMESSAEIDGWSD